MEEKRGGASPQVRAEVPADWAVTALQLEPKMAPEEPEAAIAVEWQVRAQELVSEAQTPLVPSPSTPAKEAW